jgi:hypothetical protein
LDLAAYDAYNQGLLKDDNYEISKEDIIQRLPEVNMG